MYTKTYVCDFNCGSLAEAACLLCSKHGCSDHLPFGIRVAFEIGNCFLRLPAMPLDGIDPVEGTSPPIFTFENWDKIKPEDRKKHIEASVGAREVSERRCCENCYNNFHASQYRAGGDGDTTIRRALDAFAAALRAGMAAHAMRKG